MTAEFRSGDWAYLGPRPLAAPSERLPATSLLPTPASVSCGWLHASCVCGRAGACRVSTLVTPVGKVSPLIVSAEVSKLYFIRLPEVLCLSVNQTLEKHE